MAKRHDHLFAGIANFDALHAAAKRAVLGKRKKPGASAFFANLERELLSLERHGRFCGRLEPPVVGTDGAGALSKSARATITADCGGSNGMRIRLWKVELQKLSDETGLVLHARQQSSLRFATL